MVAVEAVRGSSKVQLRLVGYSWVCAFRGATMYSHVILFFFCCCELHPTLLSVFSIGALAFCSHRRSLRTPLPNKHQVRRRAAGRAAQQDAHGKRDGVLLPTVAEAVSVVTICVAAEFFFSGKRQQADGQLCRLCLRGVTLLCCVGGDHGSSTTRSDPCRSSAGSTASSAYVPTLELASCSTRWLCTGLVGVLLIEPLKTSHGQLQRKDRSIPRYGRCGGSFAAAAAFCP